MYQKVLVPLDGSEESERVFPSIQQDVEPDGTIVLMHVIRPGRTRAMDGMVLLGSQIEDAERTRAMSYLRNVAHRLGGDPNRWRCEVVVAENTAQAIVDCARGEEVDLIAMYTHDRKGLARLFRGSVASGVQRIASTPVKVFTPSEAVVYTPTEAPATTGGPAESQATQVVRLLMEADVFRGLSDEQIDKVVSMAQQIHVSAGQLLGEAGELGDHLFIIIQGEAQLSTRSGVGEITVRIAGPGQSFPIAILVGPGTLITSGQALTDMELLEISCSQLVALCSQDPEIGLRVYSNVADLFADRYRKTLNHLTVTMERALKDADFLANV